MFRTSFRTFIFSIPFLIYGERSSSNGYELFILSLFSLLSRPYFLFFDGEEAEVLTRFSPLGPYISDGSMEGTPDTNVTENEESFFFLPREKKKYGRQETPMRGIRDSPLAFALSIAIGSWLGSLFFFFPACLFYMLVASYSFVKALLGR